jgi:glycosyltransferase involved in cell wall biosynthesis
MGIRFEQYDGIIVSGMFRLSDLKALAGNSLPPVLVYFHETQLTYPRPSNDKIAMDSRLFMADITTALCADRVAFNSEFHMTAFLASILEFMDSVPDYPIAGVIDEIRYKSTVMFPGMDFKDFEEITDVHENKTPLVIWNHRWSYDKNAASFFYAVDVMIDKGIEFELAILGECPGQRIPEIFQEAKERLGKRVVQFGYVENRYTYIDWLKRGTVAVSTAKQENFGMSMVEAMRYGCVPLLPKRLSYPEIVPERFHVDFLYSNQKEFHEKFHHILTEQERFKGMSSKISKAMGFYSWPQRIEDYDHELESLCRLKR